MLLIYSHSGHPRCFQLKLMSLVIHKMISLCMKNTTQHCYLQSIASNFLFNQLASYRISTSAILMNNKTHVSSLYIINKQYQLICDFAPKHPLEKSVFCVFMWKEACISDCCIGRLRVNIKWGLGLILNAFLMYIIFSFLHRIINLHYQEPRV